MMRFITLIDNPAFTRPYRGLVRRVDGRRLHEGWRPPLGWTTRREWHRDAVQVMPLWLFGLLWLCDSRWALIRLGLRLGVLTLPPGDYLNNARPARPRWLRNAVWCFLHDRDAVPS